MLAPLTLSNVSLASASPLPTNILPVTLGVVLSGGIPSAPQPSLGIVRVSPPLEVVVDVSEKVWLCVLTPPVPHDRDWETY